MWLQADKQKSDENFSSSPNTLLLRLVLLLSSDVPSSNYTGLIKVHMLRVMADTSILMVRFVEEIALPRT